MPVEILMPALSPTMEEGTLAKWLVKEGDSVSSGDILAEIETDKATMEFEAVDDGVIGKILVAEGTAGVKVNAAIAVLLLDGESAADIGSAKGSASTAQALPQSDVKPESTPLASPAPIVATAKGSRVFATPLARRIAAEKGLDLTQVQGSGPHGRIVKADVVNLSEAAKPAPKATPASAKAPMQASVSSDAISKIYAGREYVEVPLDGMRSTIAARLTEAKQTIPHFYLRRDIELDALLAFRSEMNKGLEARGVKLSVNDFIIKASAMALLEVPDCNAVWAGDRILKFKPCDVAVAVAIEGGLFTPVLKDADKKSISALSVEMKDLATRARNRKLAPHEYVGGSFAISNLGMFGIDNFDAVINPPHASILAVGSGVKKAVVKNDQLTIATVMSVTLSVDHRVIDGGLGAQFLEKLKSGLENPISLLA